MSKEEENKIVPKLRFPEFENDEEWIEVTLIDTANKQVKWSFTGGPFGSDLKSSDYVSYGIRIIQLQNIGDAEFINDYKIFTSENKADKLLSSNIYPGEIILSKMGDPVGRACLIPNLHSRYIMCSDGIRLVVNEQRFDKYFVYTLINSTQFRSLVEKTATGSTRKRIGLDDLKNLPMIVPDNLKEQQKIADCLSSLDDLLTAENGKLEALKAHKKGLMQQLFPAEGETVPKLRFAEFRDSGEWDQDTLENLVDLQSGYAFQSEYFSNKGMKLLTPKNFTKDGYPNFNIENTKYTTESFDPKYICREGDLVLLLTDLTPSCELLGKPLLITKENGEVLLNQRIVRIISKGNLNNRFLLYFFSTESYHTIIKNTATGSTVRHSSNTIIVNIEIRFPSSIEQQEIAYCLSSLDEFITAQAQKIEALTQHKKGLLQGLFPGAADT